MVDTKVPTIIFLCYYKIGFGDMAREYVVTTKEEKLAVVKRNLEETCRVWVREIGCNESQVFRWTNRYLAEREIGLEPKKTPGAPHARYYAGKTFPVKNNCDTKSRC